MTVEARDLIAPNFSKALYTALPQPPGLVWRIPVNEMDRYGINFRGRNQEPIIPPGCGVDHKKRGEHDIFTVSGNCELISYGNFCDDMTILNPQYPPEPFRAACVDAVTNEELIVGDNETFTSFFGNGKRRINIPHDKISGHPKFNSFDVRVSDINASILHNLEASESTDPKGTLTLVGGCLVSFVTTALAYIGLTRLNEKAVNKVVGVGEDLKNTKQNIQTTIQQHMPHMPRKRR